MHRTRRAGWVVRTSMISFDALDPEQKIYAAQHLARTLSPRYELFTGAYKSTRWSQSGHRWDFKQANYNRVKYTDRNNSENG
ncbi:hypothetical protein C173_09103 [Paenibacillus sp. FSL R7-277]|nr:hypothetical protein C173_09103 [Paenibacillus sp. FSL R7-277]